MYVSKCLLSLSRDKRFDDMHCLNSHYAGKQSPHGDHAKIAQVGHSCMETLKTINSTIQN